MVYRCHGTTGWVDSPRCEATARVRFLNGSKYCLTHAYKKAFELLRSTGELRSGFGNCECTVDWSFKHGTTNHQSLCSRLAWYEIDGIMVCKQHAGPLCLSKIMSRDAAFMIKTEGVFYHNPMCVLDSHK
jgi:hypothetical protein